MLHKLESIGILGLIGLVAYIFLFASDEDIKNMHSIFNEHMPPIEHHESNLDVTEVTPDRPMYVLQPEKSI